MQPIHKSDEILQSMVDSLKNDSVISEFKLGGVLRDIDRYFSGLEKSYAKGMAFTLARNIEKASYFFELSLQVSNLDYAINYLAVISRYGKISQYKELSWRLSDQYESPLLAKVAFETSLYMSDLNAATHYIHKAMKLSNDEDRMKLQNELDSASFALSQFKAIAGFDGDEAALLSKVINDVLDENDIKIRGIRYLSDKQHDEKLNSYIVITYCDDSSKIADMNMSLAFKLAEHDEFIGKKFGAAIRGYSSKYDVGGLHACNM